MRNWEIAQRHEMFRHRLFGLERQRLRAGTDEREAMVLRAPDWVNVIPLLADGQVLMVRQWRFGIAAPTLEIPGGMVEVNEVNEVEEERAAAQRELFEETGYRAASWRRLGEVHPNPAFLSNRCGTWLATGLERLGEPSGDGEEEIELTTCPLSEIPALIASGGITHSLVIAAFDLHGLDTARLSPRG